MDDELQPDDEVTLEVKMNLADARKDFDQSGEPYDILEDVDDNKRCSEWAVAYAMLPYNEGDTFTAKEFNERLQISILQQYMDRMVVLGYMEAIYDEEKEDVAYRLTPAGRKWAITQGEGL